VISSLEKLFAIERKNRDILCNESVFVDYSIENNFTNVQVNTGKKYFT